MEHLINKRVKGIELSGIRTFYNMVSQYQDVLSLTIGQPDFLTPQHVKEAAKSAIDDNQTSYTHNAGTIELREAAAQFVKEKYDLHYNPADEVIVTIGASQAIDIALRTILEEDSEVILPGPVYPGYEPLIRLNGAKPVHIDTTETGFRLTADLIQQHLTSKTRCVILPYPSNPTGVTLSQQELEEIAALLSDKNIFVLSDEIYSELVFDKKHQSIASISSMREKTIVINGVSKSHSMTGWRIGLLFAPSYLAKHILKVHQYNVSCASSVSQAAALEALTAGKNDAVDMKKEYEQRLNYVYDRLVNMGFDVEKPTGAFYIFPSIQNFHSKSFDFALELVKEAGVALVPGSAFSSHGEGYVRLSYAYSMNTLREACDRIEAYLTSRQSR
ncbi:aminotransferase A [Priestia megaterium]|uniref:Aminotransferase n=2 Tax=Priestia TaxID=2800373 RepID=A0A8D3X319_PRIMW|nr:MULTISPECIES: aminotransferase A [Priestia]AEN90800.1 Aminotransferase A [Priestia megaterium WSH-002]WKU22555.1 aminotransferase A [Priestia megaterium]